MRGWRRLGGAVLAAWLVAALAGCGGDSSASPFRNLGKRGAGGLAAARAG